MAPRGMVAFHTPLHGIIPPHSAALVVIPNGSGGLLQYGWFTGACSRILHQDSILVEQTFREGKLEPTIHEPILRHLSAACGAGTPELYHQRSQIGAMILSCYEMVSIEDQIFWLRHDLEVRRSNMKGYYARKKTRIEEARLRVLVSNQSEEQEVDYSREMAALSELEIVNEKQLQHVQNVVVQLLRLLPTDRASIVAAVCEIEVPLPQRLDPKKNSISELHLAPAPAPAPAPARSPLAPVSPNVQVPSQPIVQPKQGLKRKRHDPAPKKMSEAVDLLEDSEDENAFQSQVDAIPARIAAIRRRTAHEDQLMPIKKTKRTRKPSSAKDPSVARQHGAGVTTAAIPASTAATDRHPTASLPLKARSVHSETACSTAKDPAHNQAICGASTHSFSRNKSESSSRMRGIRARCGRSWS